MTKSTPRYIVGIDLGTSNSALAYSEIAAAASPSAIHVFEIEQLIAPGRVAPRPTLASVRYHPAEYEVSKTDLQLPWTAGDVTGVDLGIVGELARDLGAKVPGRVITSAKSWLSHSAVDRHAPILPWGAEKDVPKISPVAASASYLAHLRAAWNHHFPDALLEHQEIVLTVPASFDEAVRMLTLEAATLAGLPSVRLLEEPQAAFYDWLFRHRQNLTEALGATRLALVCDVGGGTTDLTLIKVDAQESTPVITRIAVGDHLMLGGDNMDLGVAHVVESRMAGEGARLSPARLALLVQQCRRAKEALLADNAPDRTNVTLLGAGTKLIGAARSVELTRDEVHHMVVDGYFPKVAAGAGPQRLRGGLVEFGLPYVSDPAVTRHLGAFLRAHQQAAREALAEHAPAADVLPVPDALLLNGGVFRSSALVQRVLNVLSEWRGVPLRLLHNDAPDLAVARGAVAFALARRGNAPKIASGAARSYFVLLDKVNGPQQSVCVLPRGTEEGLEITLAERRFALLVGEPVKFDLASSNADTPYTQGELVTADESQWHRLPPLAMVMQNAGPRSREIPVRLATTLTELGTLAMHCVSVDDPAKRWKLEFQLRGTAAPGAVAKSDMNLPPRFNEAVERIVHMYGPRSQRAEPGAVKRLRAELEKLLGPRQEWPTPLLRELYVGLWDGVGRRRRSADHERVWFNLAGFCLRPGFGYPLDDWRVRELWAIYDQGVQFVAENQVWAEWWTLWRRVAGGLNEEAQVRLLDDMAFYLQPAGSAQIKKPPGAKKLSYENMVKLAASLERVPAARKIQIGEWLLTRLSKQTETLQSWWALGRLGVRVPLYGSAHNVVPVDVATQWLEALLKLDWKANQPAVFAAASLARVSEDRARDLDPAVREMVHQRLVSAKAPLAWRQMVRELVQLDEADEGRMFGESLPPGLRLIN